MDIMKKLLRSLSIIYLLYAFNVHAVFDHSPIKYPLIDELIDVVIPTASKDEIMLNYCIEGVKKNCRKIRRIIVVSPHRITDEAEWYDEKEYPFSKFEVSLYLNQLDYDRAITFQNHPSSRLGWYYQQLLKLYSSFVIPGVSSNVLIVDADTVFFRPVEFINEEGGGNYAMGGEFHMPYFQHAGRLLPGLHRLDSCGSGIVHHMLFQKPILDDLFNQVESFHGKEFWKAFCLCVDPSQLFLAGASEYEIYFNFVFARTQQVKIRRLRWVNDGNVNAMQNHMDAGYDFIAYHAYMRN